jgi:hypothetical protein
MIERFWIEERGNSFTNPKLQESLFLDKISMKIYLVVSVLLVGRV